MKNRDRTGLFDGIKPIYRTGLVLLALFLVVSGVFKALSVRTNYYNFWGHLAFAPSLVFVGLLLIVAMILAWVRNK